MKENKSVKRKDDCMGNNAYINKLYTLLTNFKRRGLEFELYDFLANS